MMNIPLLYLLSFGAAVLQFVAAEPAEVDGYKKHAGDCYSNDISHHTLSLADCANMCTSEEQCLGFGFLDLSVFQGETKITCMLKSHVCTSLNPNQGVYFYTPFAEPLQVDGYTKDAGDCYGNDISHHTLSAADCANMCTSEEQCLGFGFIDHSVFQGETKITCMLKSHVCTNLNPKQGVYFYTPNVGDVDGYVQEPGACWFVPRIAESSSSLAECADKCTGNSRCAGFDFIDPKMLHSGQQVTCILREKNCKATNDLKGYHAYRPYYAPVEVEGYTKYEGECSGTTTAYYYTSVDACAANCNNRNYCTGFSFMDQKHYTGYIRGNNCELKEYNCAKDGAFNRSKQGVYTYAK